MSEARDDLNYGLPFGVVYSYNNRQRPDHRSLASTIHEIPCGGPHSDWKRNDEPWFVTVLPMSSFLHRT